MRNIRANSVLRYIRGLAAAQCPRDLADQELLDRFVTRRDEAAYAALVRRHGPMVLRLCLRILQNEHDAEDAFQATFLVLLRRAASLLPQESLGGWLYCVAYRVAQKARIDAARRRKYEGRADVTQVADPLGQISLREAQDFLDKELARLPDKLRAPLVLCYLEGLTRDEAAKQLGLPPSTLKSRLEQARERLRARLASRGPALAGAPVASTFSEGTASAVLPSVLLDSTVYSAIAVAAGGTMASVAPAPVAALAEGVLKAMFMTKLKIAMAVLLALVGFGTVVKIAQVHAADPGPQENPAPRLAAVSVEGNQQAASEDGLHKQIQEYMWFVTRVVPDQNLLNLQTQPSEGPSILANHTVTRSVAGGGSGSSSSNSGSVVFHPGISVQLEVSPDAEVTINGKKANLADLLRGMQVTMQIAQDRPTITRIDAITPGTATLKAIDLDKKTITVSVGGQEWTAPVAAGARVWVQGKQDGQPGQLSDLSAGTWVLLLLKVDGDRLVVASICAQGE
jgi:RNA polymerase sigma factor (sigma-70 family)